MGRRGPAPGTGGRPRTSRPKPRAGDGRKRVTVGAKPGKQVLEYRAKMGVANAGPNVTVDHKDVNAGDDRRSNLQVVSRSKNVALENKRNAGKPRSKGKK